MQRSKNARFPLDGRARSVRGGDVAAGGRGARGEGVTGRGGPRARWCSVRWAGGHAPAAARAGLAAPVSARPPSAPGLRSIPRHARPRRAATARVIANTVHPQWPSPVASAACHCWGSGRQWRCPCVVHVLVCSDQLGPGVDKRSWWPAKPCTRARAELSWLSLGYVPTAYVPTTHVTDIGILSVLAPNRVTFMIKELNPRGF